MISLVDDIDFEISSQLLGDGLPVIQRAKKAVQNHHHRPAPKFLIVELHAAILINAKRITASQDKAYRMLNCECFRADLVSSRDRRGGYLPAKPINPWLSIKTQNQLLKMLNKTLTTFGFIYILAKRNFQEENSLPRATNSNVRVSPSFVTKLKKR